jgi:hypothetical protein
MADASSLVTSIEIKVQKLIERQKTLITENERYQNEIIELKQKIEEQLRDIQDKEKRLNLLKTVKILENKEGTVEAKAKITELLREIDKCIGLLNV